MAANEDLNEGLLDAAIKGDTDTLQDCINKGADINYCQNIILATPLHQAAFHGHKDVVTLLLSAGASASVVNKQGATPLQYAASEDHTEVMALLLRA